jgi:hypothetical protein
MRLPSTVFETVASAYSATSARAEILGQRFPSSATRDEAVLDSRGVTPGRDRGGPDTASLPGSEGPRHPWTIRPESPP